MYNLYSNLLAKKKEGELIAEDDDATEEGGATTEDTTPTEGEVTDDGGEAGDEGSEEDNFGEDGDFDDGRPDEDSISVDDEITSDSFNAEKSAMSKEAIVEDMNTMLDNFVRLESTIRNNIPDEHRSVYNKALKQLTTTNELLRLYIRGIADINEIDELFGKVIYFQSAYALILEPINVMAEIN